MLIDDVTIKVQAGQRRQGRSLLQQQLDVFRADRRKGRKWRKCLCGRGVRFGRAKAISLQKEILADDGENGKKKLNDGTAGEDIILKIPVGTVLHNLDANKKRKLPKWEKKF